MEKRVSSCCKEGHLRHYLLRITRDDLSTTPFSWQIIGQHDSAEILRSTSTFATLLEAMADSAQAALSLELEFLAIETRGT